LADPDLSVRATLRRRICGGIVLRVAFVERGLRRRRECCAILPWSNSLPEAAKYFDPAVVELAAGGREVRRPIESRQGSGRRVASVVWM